MEQLSALFERHAAASLDKQQALSESIGEHAWALDLDAGTIDFNGRQTFPVQILGTESEQTATWCWAWANRASAIPPRLLSCAEHLRQIGQREQIPELRAPQLPLRLLDGHQLALIASGICDTDCYYRGPYDGGAVFVLLCAPSIRQGSSGSARIGRVFTQLIATYPVNHRRALLSYLEYARCTYHIEGGHLTARTTAGETLRAHFAADGRLVDLDTSSSEGTLPD